ncbi:SGNH hydrolase-type esterase domain-containing protein [Bombardia bombarda]|uniref:SGNH hydrolase-type esterase domain-containing protein n=1 Tax=Bombardia bombarda TaxID=252184 RepID=A0AA39XAR4_9PEZI|nr:SGNH hydrolase-type esterase domain-containing protein [Bombardia bombarda]
MESPTTGLSAETAAIVAEVESLLRPLAKYKERSHVTSKTQHIALLQNLKDSDTSPTVVLFGDSMLERMITTGQSPSLEPWPSQAMLYDASDNATSQSESKQGRLQGVANFGVGGDKIQNMAYRLIGNPNPDPAKSLPALASLLAVRKEVKLWIVHAGTNNLHPKKGLTDGDRNALAAMLRAILVISSPEVECKVLLTGLFPRKDISQKLINEANAKLLGIVGELNGGLQNDRVVFLPATEAIRTEDHLVDHVHLSLEGYRIWTMELFPAVMKVLEGFEDVRS